MSEKEKGITLRVTEVLALALGYMEPALYALGQASTVLADAGAETNDAELKDAFQKASGILLTAQRLTEGLASETFNTLAQAHAAPVAETPTEVFDRIDAKLNKGVN